VSPPVPLVTHAHGQTRRPVRHRRAFRLFLPIRADTLLLPASPAGVRVAAGLTVALSRSTAPARGGSPWPGTGGLPVSGPARRPCRRRGRPATCTDPHPGNSRLLTDGRLGVLDFGAVDRLPDGFPPVFGRVLRLMHEGAGLAELEAEFRSHGYLRHGVSVDLTAPRTLPAPLAEPSRAESFRFSHEWLRTETMQTSALRSSSVLRRLTCRPLTYSSTGCCPLAWACSASLNARCPSAPKCSHGCPDPRARLSPRRHPSQPAPGQLRQPDLLDLPAAGNPARGAPARTARDPACSEHLLPPW